MLIYFLANSDSGSLLSMFDGDETTGITSSVNGNRWVKIDLRRRVYLHEVDMVAGKKDKTQKIKVLEMTFFNFY